MNEEGSDPLRFEGGSLLDSRGRAAAWPRFGVIGDPIAHSLSPRLHGAALAARGISHEYGAIRVSDADLEEFLGAAWRAGARGLNVTAPHKSAVVAACGRRSEEVESIGAANTLIARPDGWQGHNTDARGLSLALERLAGRDLVRHLGRGVIIGAGGAARAAAYSLGSLGARELFVLARDPARARWVRTHHQGTATDDPSVLRRAGVVVHCTPLGWNPEDPIPLDPSYLEPGCLVADLVYADAPTRLLTEATRRGCLVMDGLPMLVAQAALAFAMWHGASAPLEVMAESVGLRWSQ